MRRLFTTKQFLANGGLHDQLTAMVKFGLCVRVRRGVYAEGEDEPAAFAKSLGRMVALDGPVWGLVSAKLQGFDGVEVTTELTRRYQTDPVFASRVLIDGHECTAPLQTLIDVAPLVSDDDAWEQALEFCLRKKLVTIEVLESLLPALSRSRVHGVGRIRRMLAIRPDGAPPTESLLETLFVQLARLVPGLSPPTRQYVVKNKYGEFVGRVDLCWPEFGIFIELDGKDHDKQVTHDFSRERAVIRATGWLCGRFRWSQVRHNRNWTVRELTELIEQACLRPVVGR